MTTDLAQLPHAYPFRFVDSITKRDEGGTFGGSVSTLLSANARAAMGAEWGSPVLLVEALAQAALILQGGGVDAGRKGFLAGIDGFEVSRRPQAGESLEVVVRLAARFGAVVKFDGEVRSGAETVARGSILVREGGA